MVDKAKIIREAAAQIGTRPEWLDALINFETGGTYDPMVINSFDPEAKGLIQFRDEAAQDLGFVDSTQLVSVYPDFETQMLNAVVPYFKLQQKQFSIPSYMDRQSLYMAVFYPAYATKPPKTEFPEYVQKANPGITTIQDYIEFVNRRIKGDLLINPMLPVLALAGIGGVIYWILRR